MGAVATTNPFARTWTTTVPELEALDGFSTIGGAFVRFSDELDVAALVAHAACSVRSTSPERCSTSECATPNHTETSKRS